ncbi:MAG: glycosyltransferase family 2 protein [Planctomycetes bacterium]|nr:glycosyltransferase family 2 protein [Planctomycetota bacterium]
MPAHDEAAGIAFAVAEAVQALGEIAGSWELIVVDDGSVDRTAAIVAERARHEPRIRLVRTEGHVGYGAALARGLRAARLEVVAYTDADAQFELRDLPALHQGLADVDMAVGYRAARRDPRLRRLTSAVYRWLVGVLLGLRVRDVNCALKMLRRDFVQRLDLQSRGFLVDAELFLRTRQLGGRWRELPVQHRPRVHGASSIRCTTAFTTMGELLRLRRALRR